MKGLFPVCAGKVPSGQYTGVPVFWLTEKLKKTDRENRFM